MNPLRKSDMIAVFSYIEKYTGDKKSIRLNTNLPRSIKEFGDLVSFFLRGVFRKYDALIVSATDPQSGNTPEGHIPYYFKMLTRKVVNHCLCLITKKIIYVDRRWMLAYSSVDAILIKKADVIFKREIHNHYINHISQLGLFFGNFKKLRSSNVADEIKGKTLPISLGPFNPWVDKKALMKIAKKCEKGEVKKYDVFFSGRIYGSNARCFILEAVKRLQDVGVNVYHSIEPLSPEDYWKAMAKSYLCLSPAGDGWDCYRHYEIGIMGSVPVLEATNQLLYMPFKDRHNSFYYKPASHVDLMDLIKEALKNKNHLLKMGRRARVHVLNYHTDKAISKYISKYADY